MYNNSFNNPFLYRSFGAPTNLGRMGLGLGGLRGASSGIKAAGAAGMASKFSFSSFLTNAQKTLGIINQAIPIVYQVKPMWNNAKTMFRIAGALKEDDNSKATVNNTVTPTIVKEPIKSDNQKQETILTSTNQPSFFL